MRESESSRKRHPIQVVARRTGLSLDLLRAWEKRYGVVEPGRSAGGRRLYSDDDVERLRMLRRASDVGRRISNLAGLSTDELAALVEEDAREEIEDSGRATGRDEVSTAIFLRSCQSAIERFDARELEATLRRAQVSMGSADLIDGVLAPLLQRIGELWSHGRLSPANEHMASPIVVRILSDVIHAAEPSGTAPRMVVATPAGQLHEFGALFVAATAASAGWSVTYLGRDLPGEDIAAAAGSTGADAVALSIVRSGGHDDELVSDLRSLRKNLAREIPIFVGGAAAGHYSAILEEIGAQPLNDLNELRLILTEGI
ncbi:MAG TPA: cobalamin-dependent protein [Gemmatimonadota bacterium]|nr:cobalamin-dependent protein [Gemmatimonadota bacterium]